MMLLVSLFYIRKFRVIIKCFPKFN